MKYLLLLLVFVASANAADLRVEVFYLLNRQSNGDSAAEVCFSLSPAPNRPTHVQVTVDPNSATKRFYNTVIDSRGSACLVVSTFRGQVLVEVPESKLSVVQSLQ